MALILHLCQALLWVGGYMLRLVMGELKEAEALSMYMILFGAAVVDLGLPCEILILI